MPDYTQFDVADFLEDAAFIAWCKGDVIASGHDWEAWLAAYPERRPDVEAARTLYYAMSGELPADIIEARAEGLRQLMLAQPVAPARLGMRRVLRRYAVPVAAMLAGLAVMVLYYWQRRDSGHVYRSDADDRRTLQLSDGSRVTLYPNSRLTVPAHYNTTDRRINLDGQAFFEVASVPDRPFTVVTNQLSTTALGTSFMVRDYNDQQGTRISLMTGKVAVAGIPGAQSSLILTPGEQYIQGDPVKGSGKHLFDTLSVRAVERGLLTFKDASFNEVAEKLAAFYGVTIHVDPALHDIKHFTGQFEHEPLSHVLEVLRIINGFTILQEGSTIYISTTVKH
ncbi:FecR domain-containing protein [Chitinophaga pendula]|uniref:FecR family protein n=1 Tax=Chitinophaga TaxID=79328 RepID=UPI000BAFCD6B|nr:MULTISPECIES: FecR family protein [Chitinophaga]ASZ10659.1 hypothetical protein CK934_06535 [Chitinophaga sp. MD30]UCJ06365.1 FecR domain-containing protein [Chitinophaga pendula]